MKVLFYTLGCKVNQYDTGTLQEAFVRQGYQLAAPGEIPDVVVVNTCTVTAESDRKGRQAVRRLANRYPQAIVAVTGCMPQAVPQKAGQLSAAHLVVGNSLNFQLPSLIREYQQTGQRIVKISPHEAHICPEDVCTQSFEGRMRAFVKIEDGCNRFCSYCLIPYARGRVRSKPLDVVKRELKALAAGGYQEVVLAGINLTAYGQEMGLNLCDAVEAAENTPGICRVRLGSMEPDQFTDEMICRMAACQKLCPQFHLSLQSGSDGVLDRMNRHYDTAFYENLVEHLRGAFPGCAITTDVMCGFPGEGEEEFEQTLAFLQKIGFAKVHTFVYSPREGTPAAQMQQVEPWVKKERAVRLNQTAQQLQEAYLQSQLGREFDVLLEQRKGALWEGHTPHYLTVQVKSNEELAGKVCRVRLTGFSHGVGMGELVSDLT